MKKIMIICCLAFQVTLFGQVPSIIHSPQTALENVEAQVLSASMDDMEKLFTCKFEKDSLKYNVNFLSSGQNDVVTELKVNTGKYSSLAGRTLINYKRLAVKHDYSSQSYEYFMKNLVVNFINDGQSSVHMNFNSSCEGEPGHSDTDWSKLPGMESNQILKDSEIDIELFATSEKRSTLAQCVVGIGCAVSEGWELTSQSWRYMNDAEDFNDWGSRLMISRLLSMTSIALASKYDEKLEGTITIDSEEYSMECGDEFLPHFYKSKLK